MASSGLCENCKKDKSPVDTVDQLRDISERIRAERKEVWKGKATTVFFPEKERREKQPISLEGEVDLNDIAGLLAYIADMME